VNARSACWTRLPSCPAPSRGCRWALRHEEHAHALRADQPHHLLDLLEQRRRRLAEEQVRLVEEEHELRLLAVADFGQVLEQLREQPQQERAVEPRLSSACRGEDVDDAAAAVGLHQVVDREHRLAEEPLAALFLICSRPRWIAPIDAGEMLPYWVFNFAALSPTNCSIARRSLRSISKSRCRRRP